MLKHLALEWTQSMDKQDQKTGHPKNRNINYFAFDSQAIIKQNFDFMKSLTDFEYH